MFNLKIDNVSFFKLKGGGYHSKFRKHNFEIVVDPKGPPSGSTFWSGWEAPDYNEK